VQELALNVIKVDYPNIIDHVPTEDVIRTGLLENCNSIPFEYTLVDCNWAKCINHLGLPGAQQKINEAVSTLNAANLDIQKSIFICQHISAERLQWPSKLVFCPHATKENKFIAIPHSAINYSDTICDKKYLASFIGSFETHWTRRVLAQHQSSLISVADSGKWYYENPDVNRKNAYIEKLTTSKFSLCPRGTGPSTIRIWEAMASGSVPVIISDKLIMPEINNISWNDLAVFIPEWMVFAVPEILSSYSSEQIQEMSNRCTDVFKTYCYDEILWRFIDYTIGKNCD
jgi:hypothetical protein